MLAKPIDGCMEVFRFNILPLTEIEKREAFKEAVNTCPICNSHLNFTHETEYLTGSVHEKASCPQCRILIREEDFSIQ